MLQLVDVHTYYGNSYVLQGISLQVNDHSVVALLGRNGMGKTTTIRTIMGLTPPRRGIIRFNGASIAGLASHKIARLGIGLIPQGRMIFPSLSVEENLTIASRGGHGSEVWKLERIYALFPILKNRAGCKATLLSGGEQQMLTIARALMTNPMLLLMDEPFEGLAPMIVEEIGEVIRQLKQSGFSILLVEQNISMALGLADHVYILSKGKFVHDLAPEELRRDEETMKKYLGV